MPRHLRGVALAGLALAIAGLAARAADEPPHSAELDRMVVEQARRNGVPEHLVRRIIMRESKYDARARNHKYWGLMQISYPTARSMGFTGTPEELLNPLVNLRYAVPYLANAFIIAGKREDEAVRLYAAGYYFTARQRGLLGLLRTGDSQPVIADVNGTPTFVATATDVSPDRPYGALTPAAQPPITAAAPVPALAVDAVSDAHDPQVDVAMVADKAGEMHPPKKWQRDGGVTPMARGEQGAEAVAALAGPAADKPSRHAAHRSRKSTEFAAIDPPSSAQAYAAQPEQDPRFAQAASQAAIAQATGGPSFFAAAPTVAGQPPAPEATQVAAAEPAPAAETAAQRKDRHASRHYRHGSDEGTSEVAKADVGLRGPDASADGATKDADAAPPRKHVRHARKKAEPEVAAAAPADAAPPLQQPPAQQ